MLCPFFIAESICGVFVCVEDQGPVSSNRSPGVEDRTSKPLRAATTVSTTTGLIKLSAPQVGEVVIERWMRQYKLHAQLYESRRTTQLRIRMWTPSKGTVQSMSDMLKQGQVGLRSPSSSFSQWKFQWINIASKGRVEYEYPRDNKTRFRNAC